ncbi:unnamed protein product [Linum trigynum]|uniref:Uncharacterized protein n=1 Tax=Linum trigynum TaxID=586398 RepID=A0AAV2CLG3_9ROSI
MRLKDRIQPGMLRRVIHGLGGCFGGICAGVNMMAAWIFDGLSTLTRLCWPKLGSAFSGIQSRSLLKSIRGSTFPRGPSLVLHPDLVHHGDGRVFYMVDSY